MHFIHFTIDIRNVCVFLAPLFSSLTALVTYVLTKELKVGRHSRSERLRLAQFTVCASRGYY